MEQEIEAMDLDIELAARLGITTDDGMISGDTMMGMFQLQALQGKYDINLGFTIDGYLEPDYRYYNEKVGKYERVHKFNFRKNALHRKYGLPLTMTEKEMTEKLGYYKIWDCGLIRYIWKNENNNISL